MNKSLLNIIAIFLIISSCTSNHTSEEVYDDSDSTKVDSSVALNGQEITSVIQSIPSPLELTSLIKQSGAEYSSDILNKTSNKQNYNTPFKKAINLGIYGADMGYVNLYEKTFAAADYLESVKTLANDLKVGQFFDFESIKRLASNSKNVDSLLYISTSGFEKMNNYLTKQKRNNISVLILVGGWLETVYLSTETAQKNSNKELIERVGEQKISLEQIVKLLSVYQKDPEFAQLVKDCNDLKTNFDKVTITYIEGEPIEKEVNGMLIVEEQTKEIIDISPEVFKVIAGKVREIRSKLI